MIVHMTMAIRVHLPDGSASMDMQGGRGWVLPNGDFIKIWAGAELNDDRDLTYDQCAEMGVFVEDIITDAEIAEEQAA